MRAAQKSIGGKKRLFALAAALICCLLLWMAAESHIVRVESADVYLSDLPAAFDGTSVLFVSDALVGNFCPPEKAAALVNQLQALKPDLLLMGGDYGALDGADYLRALVGQTPLSEARNNLSARRNQFFLMLRQFEAPLGKYAVAGDQDYLMSDIDQAAALGGFTLLKNSGKTLIRGAGRLIIAGLDDWKKGEQDTSAIASAAGGDDCVILLSHNPDALPSAADQPSADGTRWIDLMLSGHTLGGQFAPFGRGLATGSIYGDRYRSGWYEDKGALLLVSNGVGARLFPLRLGAPPQAHFITLYKK